LKTGINPGAVLILSVLLSGCESIAYYSQAVGGQFEIWSKQRDIDTVMMDPEVDAKLKERIEVARQARVFATDVLKLPDNKSYSRYADIGRNYVVWNVVATPAYSIEPIESCFPVVGCVSYRGYYAKAEATEHARAIKSEGKDVYVGGVTAYSTLGWFDDPLLNTMLTRSDAAIAALIFHELAHQVVFIKGNTQFNESFATAVERIGLLQWARAQKSSSKLEPYFEAKRKRESVVKLVLEAREKLDRAYQGNANQGAGRQAKAKQFQFAALQQRYVELKDRGGGTPGFDQFFASDINNASLALFGDYHARVDEFTALFEGSDKDWPKFYAAVRALAKRERRQN
jgi:predicted aminopeptidase